MKDGDKLRVTQASIEDGDKQMSLSVQLENQSDSTLHFVAALRQLLYDAATKELTVRLTDAMRAELPFQPPFEAPPPMAAVDARGKREIVVKLPRFVTRIEPGPSVVQIPAHEAQTVTIEVGWSDKAFYRDPRGKAGSLLAQMKKWEQGRVTYRGQDLISKRPSRK